MKIKIYLFTCLILLSLTAVADERIAKWRYGSSSCHSTEASVINVIKNQCQSGFGTTCTYVNNTFSLNKSYGSLCGTVGTRYEERLFYFSRASGGANVAYAVIVAYENFTPPSCEEKQGDSFALGIKMPNDQGADEDGCYFSCNSSFAFGEDPAYSCTYNGENATPNSGDPDKFDNEDTSDPNYCNNSTYDGTENGTCIDFDHPDNEGGCGQYGKSFGTVGTEFGTVTGCFGGGQSDYEPEGDLDGDGIANSDDPDIDNDGILNDDDPDENGDGINEKLDTDGDGIPDSKDPDIDGDGTPNGQDPDKDGDGIANEDDQSAEGEGQSQGEATVCAKKPTSSGDKQLAAIHMQLWLNNCKGNKNKDVVDKLEEIKQEFANLTEEVDQAKADTITDGVQQTGIDEANTVLDDHITGIDTGAAGGGPMNGIIEATGIDDTLINFLPAPSACTPMQLNFASKINLPIPCEKFNLFKEWFGWALAYFTIYSIIMLAIAPVPSKV